MFTRNIFSGKKLVSYGKLIQFPHYETIFKWTFLIVLCITTFNVQDIIAFRKFANQNGIKVFELSELKLIPAIWVLIYVTKCFLEVYYVPYLTVNLHQKYQGKERSLRIKKIIKWIIDFLIYSLTTISAWVMFHEEDWYPSELYGDGSCSNLSKDYPHVPDNDFILKFYLFQLSIHTYSTLELLVYGRQIEIKFWEYLLHHYVASVLIFFSLGLNIWKIGAIVMVIHDFSDVFLSCGRGYGDIKSSNKYIVYSSYTIMLISWFYLRLFVFPKCVLKNQFDVIFNRQGSVWETNLNAWVFQTLLLVILQLMHIYWSVYIMKVGVGIFKAGRYKNVYDNKENKID